MIDELCKQIISKYTIDELKKEALQYSHSHDYATALAWTAVNKSSNAQLGGVGEHLANSHFGWKHVGGEYDSLIGDQPVEIKTSAPPKGGYRIGQIKLGYSQQPSLFCQFFHFQTKAMQFYFIPTIAEFLAEFDQWIGNDQGKDGTNVGIRSIPHGKECWTHLQQWRIDYDDIPRGL